MDSSKLTSDRLAAIANHTFERMGKNDRLTGLDAALIWQYVRFNPDYRLQFDELKRANPDDDDIQSFCSHWNISEPLDYNSEVIPDDFRFEHKLVRKIVDLKKENYLFNWNSDPIQPQVILAINTNGDPKQIIQEVTAYLKSDGKANDSLRLRPNNIEHLAETFLIFYLREVQGLTNSQARERYAEIVERAATLSHNQADERMDSFKQISSKAPWCFFVAYGKSVVR